MGVLLILIGSCKKKDNSASPETIEIGHTYAGGIIFYIDSTKQHGFVCASTDQGNGVDWATAFQVCTAYKGSGFNDWFLPPIDKLRLMYWNLFKKGIGNFQSSGDYWSSTEATYYYAWYFEFWNAKEGSGDKGAFIQARAVRAF